MKRRRGVILPVILFVLLLVGLFGAMFSFRVNADLASTQAVAYRLQTRLAAEAGIERVKLLLRDSRFDQDVWYDNPDELHRIIVWTPGADVTLLGTNEEFANDHEMVYRFSIVADDPTTDEDFVRFGITDESSKVNLNVATEQQLMILVNAAVDGDEEIVPQHIVDAILDWRDKDARPRGENPDTEGEYYASLGTPYRVKNAPFDSVEELLLVKGVTGRILYGEDVDRNGLLTPNEDDGDRSFPPDNEDGQLNRGLYPYLTVHSYENNVGNHNRPRVYLFGDEAALRDALALEFDDKTIEDFVVAATRAGPGGSVGAGGNTGTGGDQDSESGSEGEDSTENEEDTDEEGGEDDPEEDGGGEESGLEDAENDDSDATESDDDESLAKPIRSPASLLLERTTSGQAVVNPLGVEHLPILMDRFTAVKSDDGRIAGLINVNTAPRRVLQTLDGLTNDEVSSIIDARDSLDAETRSVTSWLVTEEVIGFETYERIAPLITGRGQQFTVESLGYADHIGMVTRLEAVLDLVGPIAQVIYYRDVTQIGGHYPIRESDLERVRVR